MLKTFVTKLRRLAATVRDDIDRRLHPARHRRARERLAAIAPTSLLFVCLGNICRSPYGARQWSRRAVGTPATSAGFIGPDRQPPELALAVAKAHGLEHSDHRSRIVSPDVLRAAGAILIFDREHVRRLEKQPDAPLDRVFWLADLDPTWRGSRAIPDPWGKPEHEFEAAFSRIDGCLDALAEILGDQPNRSPTH